MLSIHQGFNQNFGSIYMWDIRRPHIAIAVFKLQEQVTSPKLRTDNGDGDQFDDNMNTDWIASFSVTNDGTSMFVMTRYFFYLIHRNITRLVYNTNRATDLDFRIFRIL